MTHALRTEPSAGERRAVRRCAECGQRFGPEGRFCPFDGTALVDAVWDPTTDPLLGASVDGRYEVVSVLGEGGMGTVYDVRHKALNRHFAMKVLRADVASDEPLAVRFVQEAQATAKVRHPNVVEITDFGRLEGGVPYFVMDLLVGETLAQVIKRTGPMSVSRAARIAMQIASALSAAHKQGIVHRDVKPDNVFLVNQPDPNTDLVKVVDFGAAKVAGASHLTKKGIIFGTPHYMAPEQARGDPVDARTDVYALGVILYELFTGRVPFEADTYMGVITKHMFAQPIPPSVACPATRNFGPLEGVVLRALQKDPKDRHPSMDAFHDEVQQALTQRGKVSDVPGASVQAHVAARFRPKAPEIGPAPRRETAPMPTAPPPDMVPLRRFPLVPAVAIAAVAAVGLVVLLFRMRGSAPERSKPPQPSATVTVATYATARAPELPRAAAIAATTPIAPVSEDDAGTAKVRRPPVAAATAPRAPKPSSGPSATAVPTRPVGGGEIVDPWQ